MIKILFICHGNICRSPMAEFIMKDLLKRNNLTSQFRIASAATSMEEIGNGVHPGTKRILSGLGISCAGKQAVRLERRDYKAYDYLIGMDQHNISNMLRILGNDPEHKVSRLLDFTSHPRDIADPWYTGNFDQTYEDVLEGCEALFSYIQKDTALRFLMQEPLRNISITELIRRDQAKILHADEHGVLIQETKQGIHMMAVDSQRKGKELLSLQKESEMFVVHQEFMVDEVTQKYGFTTCNPCIQAVYTKTDPLPLKRSDDIHRLDMSFQKVVCDNYHTVAEPDYIESLIQSGHMLGIFVDGELAGFIGIHAEGSIGLLEIFEQYRRRGLAMELQKFMINYVLELGFTPFGQVIDGNEASMRLQNKIGMEIAEGKIYWMY